VLGFSSNLLVPFGSIADAFWLSSCIAAFVKTAAISCNQRGALTAEGEKRALPQDNLTAIDELKKSANKLGLKELTFKFGYSSHPDPNTRQNFCPPVPNP